MTSRCGRSRALRAQRVALLDAEAVLLVDDNQAQVEEVRLCSWIKACVPTTIPASPEAASSMRFCAGGGRHRAGQQHDRACRARSRRADRRPRARTQHRGQRERTCCWASTSSGASSAAWPPASTTAKHRPQRHQRLARAHLTLQQAVHRVLFCASQSMKIVALIRCWPAVSWNGRLGVEGREQARRRPARACATRARPGPPGGAPSRAGSPAPRRSGSDAGPPAARATSRARGRERKRGLDVGQAVLAAYVVRAGGRPARRPPSTRTRWRAAGPTSRRPWSGGRAG